MKIQKFLLIALLGFSTTIHASMTCSSLLDTPLSKLKTVEASLLDSTDDLNAAIRAIEELPMSERLAPEFSWFLAKAHYKKGGPEGFQSSYQHLRFLMNHMASRNNINLLPGMSFVEAYLHLRKKLGLNSFDPANTTDQNFIGLTSMIYRDNHSFDSTNWGPFSLHSGPINSN